MAEMEKQSKTEDRRVRRTKKLLMQGLTQLLKKKQLKDITVRELADLVDLNRGTFYIHYRDVFDMLEQMEQELFEQFDRLMASHAQDVLVEHAFPLLRDLFTFIGDNADLCKVLMGENGDIAFLNRLNDVLRNKCLHDWMTSRKNADTQLFNYGYSFAVSGCVGIIRMWLDEGMKEPPNKIAEISEHIIQHGIAQA